MKRIVLGIALAVFGIGIVQLGAPPAAKAKTIGERCATMKIRAAAKNASEQLRCAARSIVDPSFDMDVCIDKAGAVLARAYAYAEALAAKSGGSCGTVDDALDIESEAGDFCARIVSMLPSM